MKTNQQFLQSMLHTVQMGQSGIDCVLSQVQRPKLKEELLKQRAEYDRYEHQAKQIAAIHNWQISDISPAVTAMSRLMSKCRLLMGDVDSKIAGMMIQGNTRGMITGLKDLHRCTSATEDVYQYAQNLLNTENINIQKTQPYL